MEVRGLRKHFEIPVSPLAHLLARVERKVLKAVDGIDLVIRPGETLGLVGESGCGKTTLGRTILRLHEPTAGQVLFDGHEVGSRELPMDRFRREAQLIFQNPYSSLNPRKTVLDIVGVALVRRGVRDPRERERAVQRLLEHVGLNPRHINAYPHQFSGGQRQRIGIARALAMEPRFIVADEPVSSLDVSVQAQIINLMQDLQEELHLTYLFIAHDLSVIYYVSDRVAVMYLGKVVELADTTELFRHTLHPYTQALLSAIPVVEPTQRRERIILRGTVPSPLNPPSGCRFHPRCPVKIGPVCEEVEPPLVDLGGHQVACHLYPGPATKA